MEGFVRVEVVRASPKGRGQGANLNIPARVYEAMGRPTVLALYMDGRGRLLLVPLRSLEQPRLLRGGHARAALEALEGAGGAAEPVPPTRLKERLQGHAAPTLRVYLKPLGHGETLAALEHGGRREHYRVPQPLHEALEGVIEALGVEGDPPPLKGEEAVLVEVDGSKARLYIIQP